MIKHMERIFIRVGFLDADHPKGIMRALRRRFGRSQMDHHLRNQKTIKKNPSRIIGERGRWDSFENQNIFWCRSYSFFKKGPMMSIGTGKMVVEFFSVAISAKV